jgi:minor extracellular protease Epr
MKTVFRDAENANIPFLTALTGALRRCSSLMWRATRLSRIHAPAALVHPCTSRHSERLALHPASTPQNGTLTISASLIALLVSLAIVPTVYGAGPLGDQVTTMIEQNVENTAQQAVEDAVLEEVEDAAVDAAESAIADTVEQSVADSLEQSASQQVQDAVANTVEESVESNVGQAVEDQITDRVDDSVGQTVSDIAEDSVALGVQDTLGETLGDTLPAGMGDRLEDTFDSHLPEQIADPASDNLKALGDTLPTVLAVTNTAGKTLFQDVEVENQWRAVANEWLLLMANDEVAVLEQLGATILERTHFDQLGMTLVRFRVADELNTLPVLQDRLGVERSQFLDRNHIYNNSPNYSPQSGGPSTSSLSPRTAPVCVKPVAIGVIDSAVDTGHRAFADARIEQRNFLPVDLATPTGHGSAVVGQLVGQGAGLQALTPQASLAVASVMYQREDGSQGATLINLLAALDWLAARRVTVINMSLAGPPNRILEQAIAALAGKKQLLVAAVGNDGPAAPALYPAAYPGVIGATAVDGKRRIYRWANRGDQVVFAAYGVGVKAVGIGGRLAVESGTSMAAPVVSAFVACLPPATDGETAVEQLAKHSIDLGEPGRDTTFGYGLLE